MGEYLEEVADGDHPDRVFLGVEYDEAANAAAQHRAGQRGYASSMGRTWAQCLLCGIGRL